MAYFKDFQDLLKTIFRFEDAADLDFGIYRIINYKKNQIEKFINTDLKEKVEQAFTKHKSERLANVNTQFEVIKQRVIETLGADALTPSGDLKQQYKETPVGKEYLQIQGQKEEVDRIDDIQAQVFNDLYKFFSRYYEEGDFVPKFRQSIKDYQYAIPYDGEEVKLYWANYNQYFIKTTEFFRNYTFWADSGKTYKVVFKVVSATEEVASNKATKERFFILDDENPLELSHKTLTVKFQYRELTQDEIKLYEIQLGSNIAKQEKINAKIHTSILRGIDNATLKGYLSSKYKDTEKTILEHQLNQYTAKNTKDYFIHKDLKGFLTHQLDYFIKAEVLDIETLEKEKYLDKHITRAKVVKEIGESIIDFLSQIEDFQKRLWEKKKFVLRTEYVITTDRVPEEFYEVIFNNKDQKHEWKELGFDIPRNKANLKKVKLPIDTKYFSIEFKEKLLEKLTENKNLDDILDGLLIKSENWQALNLLLEKYKGRVQCIYIDPPFNTGEDFLYKDNYQNSCWISLLENRIKYVKSFLKSNGSFYLHLDENANYYGRILINNLNFGNVQEISFNTNATKDEEADLYGYKSFGNRFVLKHSTIFYCFNNDNYFVKLWKPNRNQTKLNIGWLI